MKKAEMRKINDFDMGTTMAPLLCVGGMCVLACVGGQGRSSWGVYKKTQPPEQTPCAPANGSPVCLTSVSALPASPSLPPHSLSHLPSGRVEKSTIAALRKLTENQRSRRKKRATRGMPRIRWIRWIRWIRRMLDLMYKTF